jgi:hypothetical protein
MRKRVVATNVIPGRWLADSGNYAAMQVTLSDSDARLIVSLTALDTGSSPVCTLAMACERGTRTLELIAGFRIHFDESDRPDLAMYLCHVISTEQFRRRVLKPFVAELQSCGMY